MKVRVDHAARCLKDVHNEIPDFERHKELRKFLQTCWRLLAKCLETVLQVCYRCCDRGTNITRSFMSVRECLESDALVVLLVVSLKPLITSTSVSSFSYALRKSMFSAIRFLHTWARLFCFSNLRNSKKKHGGNRSPTTKIQLGGSCWARRISNLVVGQLVFRGRNSCVRDSNVHVG